MKVKACSIVAFLLSLVICLVVVITAFIDGATYLSRLHTTIIAWQLPLVTMGVIAYSFFNEKEEGTSNFLSWVSVIFLTVSFFCSNLTKNAVQDVGSNVENYVDVAASIIKEEKDNAKDYGKTIEKAMKINEDDDDDRYSGYRDGYRYGF